MDAKQQEQQQQQLKVETKQRIDEEETKMMDKRRDLVSPPAQSEPQRGVMSEAIATVTAATREESEEATDDRPLRSPTSPMQKSPKTTNFRPIPTGIVPLRGRASLWAGDHANDMRDEASILARASEPKVQVPHRPLPGRAPRRVEVERLKKIYASWDLGKLLEERRSAEDTFFADADALPLYPFDDTEFEERTLETWIKMGSDPVSGDFVGLPAKARRDDGSWAPCVVRAWNPNNGGILSIEWSTSQEKRAGRKQASKDGSCNPEPEGKQASVLVQRPRLDVYLLAESPVQFADRVTSAHRRRAEARVLLNYNLLLDSMPVQGVPTLDQQQIQRIRTKLATSLDLSELSKAKPKLMDEVHASYAGAINKIIFLRTLDRIAHGSATSASAAQRSDTMLAGLLKDLLPHADLVQSTEPESAAALAARLKPVDVAIDFNEKLQDFAFKSLYTQDGVMGALETISLECVKVLQYHLFNTTIAKSVKLDEFQNLQNTAATNTVAFVKGKWTMAVKNIVRASFKDVGKGWFNLRESSSEVYNFSKLKRFFTLVNCMMQDSMRFMTVTSLKDYVTFLRRSADARITIRSATDVEIDYKHAVEDSKKTRQGPLFALELVVEEREIAAQATVVEGGAGEEQGSAKGSARSGSSENNGDCSAAQGDEEDDKSAEAKEGEAKEGEGEGEANGEGEGDGEQAEVNGEADEGADAGKFAIKYNLNPAVFLKIPVQLFFKALASLQHIPRVEKQVMDKLFWPDEPLIRAVSQHEQWVQDLAAQIESSMTSAVEPLQDYLKQYDQHLEFLNFEVEDFMKEVKKSCRDASEEEEEDDDDNGGEGEGGSKKRPTMLDPKKIKALIDEHTVAKEQVGEVIPSLITVGVFSVSCSNLRRLLQEKHQELIDKLKNLLATRTVEVGNFITEQYGDMRREIEKPVENIEELTAVQQYMEQVPTKVRALEADARKVFAKIAILDSYWYQFKKQDDIDLPWIIFGGPKTIAETLEKAEARNEMTKVSYQEQQQEEQEAFTYTMTQLAQDIEGLSQYADLGRVNMIAKRVRDLRGRLNQAEEDARRFNSREILFEQELTNYDAVADMGKEFEPYETLWNSADAWLKNSKLWTEKRFTELHAEEIEGEVYDYHRNLIRSVKFFEKKELADVVAVAEEIKTQVEHFKPVVPLVLSLRNPGMRERHWKAVNAKLGYTTTMVLDPEDPEFTLQKLMSDDLGLLTDPSKADMITKAGEVAGKEFQIEVALDKMENEWNGVDLDIVPYKETGTYVLRGFDELQALLDEHVTMTQAMMFSAFKGPFEERIEKWNHTLSVVSDVLDEWVGVQRNWLYLQPIFDSPDINKQLPTEGKRFATVDKNWRQTLGSAFEKPCAIKFCSNEALLDRWIESNKFLDMVSKGLSDYLETKRSGFARFYFLSNEELLEILSQTKDPTMVQPHLKKCFEGIKRVHFDENQVITDMFSSEGEQVKLAVDIDPDGRNVEDWMTMLDDTMKQSVKEVLYASMLEYVEIPRTDWIQKVAGQCAINGSQFHWTREIEEGMELKGADGVQECFEQQVRQISDMVELVRDPNLKRMARITLSALTVIDVHARDVTEKLAAERVSNKEEFLWISQMRFYWEDGEGLDGDMRVMMVSSRRPYGYEYLGNSFRLVITPLTDKCYLTLMGALQMTLGGAPAGPAGTGKTETTKDLAKALAKQCVVFNCSDGLDYLAMGKFFKGLGSCGAWACFDEFNRIDVEVLSVVAQQIMTLQHAAKAGLDRIEFEGTMINMNDQFAVYITMNPGYAGRTELPDNLKALFRPVAMMVPDYALIGEIMLYSFGYAKARICAKKMVATFQLCSEQLSSQDHYDYGMRAVKTVIVAAGNLKAAEPDTEEEVLLLRALQDVNLPKFLSHDLPLFKGIISDLFPGRKRPDIDYGELLKCLKITSEKMSLQPVPFFMQKCIQLYETIVVRHGLMLVGPTGGGKSRNVECLDETLCLLKKRGVEGFAFENVARHTVNPKSITMGQLYGEFDPNTHEWQDGILAFLVRECAKSTTPDRKWIMFDGPVDAIWIENMNTVLDDNKKLCLNSGEIVALSPEMTMMFEVEDLEVASPATVSRVGIVYMEPHSLGLDPVQRSWLETLPELTRTPEFVTKLQTLFDKYVKSLIWFLRRNFKEPVPTCDNALNASLLKCLDCYFAPFKQREGAEPVSKAKVKEFFRDLEPIFLFCAVWSLCCTVDREGRERFDQYMRNLMTSHDCEFCFPEAAADGTPLTIYDFVWSVPVAVQDAYAADDGGKPPPEKRWTRWMETIKPFVCDPELSFHETIVPTRDSICYTYLIDILLRNGKHLLMTGPTGTGKTVNINKHISTGMPANFIPLMLTFSAQTSANQTQDLIDGKCEKRRKGVFGPPAGKQYIIFIDDLNMPKREEYFAQPPIEIVRQWFTYGGWYDRKALSFRKLIDITMCGAMGPPGGGRNPVTARLIRHYTVINYTEMDNAAMQTIYETIVSAFVKSNQLDSDFLSLGAQLVTSTIDIFQTICKELLPTPAKSHYTYNLRDVGKVFQGLLMVNPRVIQAREDMIRLWVHESRRVFADRLINNEDRNWFDGELKLHISERMHASPDVVFGEAEHLLFCDFLVPGESSYEHVTDLPGLLPLVEEYLVDYNAESKQPMNLVMFMDAITHICRITRVLRQPLGNVLLLGVGGSGRQSLTKLSSFICDFFLYQVEISKGYGMNEWRDDVKTALLKAGIEDKQVSFLFVDTQIIDEQMLEDINGILNSGDVPNLYAPEDMESIMTACKIDCTKKRLPPTKINIYSQYLLRVKRNIHMCLCMSPAPIFRERLRMFPSLVNCCAIDWFSEWPEEALRSVGMGIMQEVDLKLGDHLHNIVELFKVFHQSVAEASVDYFSSLRRYNYVTPTSYLELLNTFKVVLQKKRLEVGGLVQRLQTGLDKLLTTSEMVAELQKELTAMQPNLVKTQAEVEEMIKKIAVDKEGAKETMEIVAREEAEAETKAAKTKEIADDAQRDLDEALPALDQAVACLNKLKKADLDEVKSLKTPPKGVKLTMEAACIMFGVKPVMVKDPDNMGAKIKDYWVAAKGSILVNANQLLQDLMTFDKDNIAEKTIEQITAYIDMPEFTPAEIEKASKACTAICMWVRAMYKYHNVAKAVEPKKALLAEAQAELDETMSSLNDARARLKGVQDQIAALEADFEKSNAKKQQLENDVEQCAARLERAQKLIGGLGGERDRWTSSIEQLNIDYVNLIGDVLISSGCIAYLGPFTSNYREDLTQRWLTDLQRLELPHTPGVDIVQTLGDPVTIRSWNVAGLPSDAHSVQNGIVISEARRWPLLIDPQTQANRYIKNMGRDRSNAPNGIEVVKQSDKNLLRVLENGVRFGKWVLMENVGEKLDAALEPVLQQLTFKQGSQVMMRLGDSTIPYNDNFRFFMTTKLPNPHYPPEVSVKVSLLNFSITPQGLEDQLLGVVMVNELPEKEEKKNALVVNNARMAKELKDIEDTILYMLSNSQGNILDDQELIETLATSKVTSNEINKQVEEAKETEKELDAERESYRPVAFRGSLLFFTISELRNIDPMYEYSLQFFVQLFSQGILNSEHPENPADIPERIRLLNEYFTYSLYQNICRSLFEKHKLLFSFSLVIKVLQGDNKVDPVAWRYLLSGQAPTKLRDCALRESPPGGWVTDSVWSEVVALSEGLEAFAGFAERFMEHIDAWKRIFDSETAHTDTLPDGYSEKLTMLEKLCAVRCIRPDKIVEAVQLFVSAHFGQRFIEPPPFEIEACYKDSTVVTPLIFVLTSGSDPTKDFLLFAEGQGRKVSAISLGQGQGPLAEAIIEQGAARGNWVLLQNCHLASSWMPKLEQICENLDPDELHKDFRLWLTSMPSKIFPVSVLQNGIKLTKEPPSGLRANLKQAYFNLDDDELSVTNKPAIFRKLLFGLCFFHALIQERRKFGPLGWNVPYEFNDTDLDISRAQLELYLDKYEEPPYTVLRTLTAIINYGGRVTDAIDIRTIDVILKQFYNPDVLKEGYKFSASGVYSTIEIPEDFQNGYLSYIDGLPVNSEPEVFGLHDNANISYAMQETIDLFDTLMLLQPRSGGSSGSASREEIVTNIAKEILGMLPPLDFDLESIQMAYPTRYDESMNTVLVQEVSRYQRLLTVVRESLPALIRALAGLVVLSTELDQMANAMFAQKVPTPWESVAYPSLKPLMPWVKDLCERIAFLRNWVDNGIPPVYWVSGFFFPQAFFTGQLQNFARKLQISIDTTSFKQAYLREDETQIEKGPEDGAYIYGLFLEGARWDHENQQLAASEPKVLYTKMPVIHFVPEQDAKPVTKNVYRAPVYKVLSRRGTLSTTGHSTNFVMWIAVPTNENPDFEMINVRGDSDRADLIRAGVACFCSLKF